jgi:hypothetical protein
VVAVGTRWGGTQYNCRDNDLPPAPFGAVLSLAGASRAERVAPTHFRGYGGVGWKDCQRLANPSNRPTGPVGSCPPDVNPRRGGV